MKKQLLFLLSALFIFSLSFGQNTAEKSKDKNDKSTKNVVATNGTLTKKQAKAIRKKHAKNLANSPFKETMLMSKDERKANGLPPNKYYEMEWELTMDPELGRPTVEKLNILRERLIRERAEALANGRTPGDAADNNWAERGPNNVGGRTRAIMFDPTDLTYNTVIAGGVSGGLWKNTNISSAGSSWTRINIPENLNVTSITFDPNNTSVWYAGTGESCVFGDVNGDGVWKTSNAGLTWSKVLGGISGATYFSAASSVTINSPAGIAGSYACYPTTAFGPPITTAITQNIVLIVDNTAPTSNGCETVTNAAALNGKIALIRRGTCSFVTKILAAQAAGAVGVIVMNNVDGTPVPMGDDGSGASVLIPSVMVSKADGDILEAALGSATVNGTLNPSLVGVPTGSIVPGVQNINDVVVKNNGGVSEIFVAAGDGYYSSGNSVTYQGAFEYGIYKSTNGGTSWTLLTMPTTANGNRHCPNDIEIGSDGRIWVSTTDSWTFGDGGGRVFGSADGGTTFTPKHTVTGNGGGARVEIEISNTNPNKIYVLSELSQADSANPTIEVKLEVTTDGFTTTPTVLALPVGNETRETTYGFTGAQAFYDLMIESDPTNDQIIYVGGIDLYRSANGGATTAGWVAISNWTVNVHSDQHAMTFKPGAPNIAVFGNDGGVYYSGSLSTTGTAPTARNTGLNITQFYSVGVAPTNAVSGLAGEYFAAGAQDNGTQYFANASAGVNASVESQGGDGAYTMFDQGADKYYISNYVYNENINLRPLPGSTVAAKTIDADNNSNNGAFIAPMILDSNLDFLYSDYTTSAGVYQIRRYGNLKGGGPASRTTFSNALLTSSPTAFAVSPHTTTATVLLVGTRLGKLYRIPTANTYTGTATTTGTWVDITGPSFVGSISDIEFGSSNNEIFVTMHNYNVVSVWYTKDAGVTWTNKEGNFPDIPVKAIMRNPLKVDGSGFATEVIIGTELGVWYSSNFDSATPTWNQSYNGMSNVKVMDLDLRNDNTVFAATYGRGIFSGAFTATTLSAEDNALVKGIKLYPNPSNGVVTISVPNYSGNLDINVFDLNGRKVLSSSGDFSSEKAINLTGLQSGVYIVKLEGENLSYSEKVVLN
ncbi:PA domain-containing protein [Flavobacterium lacisediminis]|nr:PA domain-containing protein [Flavobacterium lacisediminis]